jgi:Domain of unknown function (DUF4157)
VTPAGAREQAERRADNVAATVSGPGAASEVVDPGRAPGPTTPTPRHVRDVVDSPGRPVNGTIAERFGAIGHDVGQVRIHADPAGDASARRLGALGYTFGSHVVVRTDQGCGETLLAHELAHTAQQAGGPPVLQLQDDPQAPAAPEAADDDLAVAPAPAADADAGTRALPVPDAGVDAGTPTVPVPDAGVDAGAVPDAGARPAPPVTAITGSVGRRAANGAADVALVQDRLLALGLLSAEDHVSERPSATNAGTGAGTDAGAVTDAGAAAPIREEQLTATIAAIIAFQKPLGLNDGNIGPTGPTWRALATLDAAGYQASLLAWQERERQRQEAQSRAAEQATAAAKPPAPSRTAVAGELITKYVGTFGTDTTGLGQDLAGRALSDPELVPVVLDRVSWMSRDNVAYEVSRALTDDQVAALPVKVRERLAQEMDGGWRTSEEAAQIARLRPAVGAADAGTPTAADAGTPAQQGPAGDAAGRARTPTGTMAAPVVDGKTLDERVVQLRAFYDTYWVSRASTDNCHEAAKAALEKMGYTVGGGPTALFPTPIGDTLLTPDQNATLQKAILDEIRAGRPVEIGIDYQAGNPGNVDQKTDHWLYVVAVTHDDDGALVLVAYDNAALAGSAIVKGQVVFFRLDEMGRFQHPAYFPTSEKPFSNKPHLIVNVRPVAVPPAK